MDRLEIAPQPRALDEDTARLFREIERSGALPEEVTASAAATAVLGTLMRWLSRGEAQELAENVPPTLRRLLDRHALDRQQRPAAFDRPTFVYEIGARLRIETDAAFRLARAVFAAVRARLPAEERSAVEAMLSYDLAELWRA